MVENKNSIINKVWNDTRDNIHPTAKLLWEATIKQPADEWAWSKIRNPVYLSVKELVSAEVEKYLIYEISRTSIRLRGRQNPL